MKSARTVELAINLRDKIEICIYTVLNANEVGNLLGDALSRNGAKGVCVCDFFREFSHLFNHCGAKEKIRAGCAKCLILHVGEIYGFTI